jgi:outer membrane protein assembly factor BamB
MALISIFAATVLVQSVPPRPSDVPSGLFPIRKLWTLTLNSALVAPPALSGTRGYFPIDGNRVAAYDLVQGSLRWIATVATVSRPAVGDDLVFIAQPDRLTALGDAVGDVAWEIPFEHPLAVPLLWDTGWLVAASAAGTVFALRASDGEIIWRRDVGSKAHAQPAFAASQLYVPLEDGRIVALRVEDGAPVWERRLGGSPSEVLALDERLYVGATDNYLYCLRTATGRVDWRWRTGADVVGRPAVDERRVYFVSLDNVLRALDRNSGAQRWQQALPLRPIWGPTPVADTLIVSGLPATTPAYSMRDGSPAGEVVLTGELASAPHVFTSGGLPVMAVVTNDVSMGAVVTAIGRTLEPPIRPLAPLPNPVQPPPVPPLVPAPPATQPPGV